MPEHSRAETVAFVAKHMKSNPGISMTELKKLGKPEGFNVYPLIIGYARKELGMAKPGPSGRGPGRPPGKRGPGRPSGSGRGPGRPPGKRGPGRPPGSGRGPGRPPKSAGAMDLNGLIEHVRGLQRDADNMRAALAKIADLAGGR